MRIRASACRWQWTHDEEPGRRTHAKNQKSVLSIGMLPIVEDSRERIVKYRLRFLEPDAMFAAVGFIFGLVPIAPVHSLYFIYL